MIRTANNNQLKMNEQLPILLISGKDDPFGDYGKGIRKLERNSNVLE